MGRIGRYAALALMALTCLARPASAHQDDAPAPAPIVQERPGGDASAPTEVRFGLGIIDVVTVNDAAEVFEADVVAIFTWHDPRLAGIAAEGERVQMATSDIWDPRITVVNGKAISVDFADSVDVDSEGHVVGRQRIAGQFTSRFDLRRFPFDVQELVVSFVAATYREDQVTLIPDPALNDSRSDISPAGWAVEPGEQRVVIEQFGAYKNRITRMDCVIVARRLDGFYLYKVFLPLSLIVLMAWAVFWIDPEDAGPQIGIATSSVFTLIAFEFYLGSVLPKVAYLTRADMFVFASTLLIFCALAEAIWTARLARRTRIHAARRLDQVFRVLYVVAFAAVWAWTLRDA